MKSLYTIAALVLLSAISPLSMAGKTVELGWEATPSKVRLPDSVTGELTLQGCPTCKVLRLRASAATRYVIAGQDVSLADMKSYLQRNPEASLVVMQLKDTLELSRLVVHVPGRAQ